MCKSCPQMLFIFCVGASVALDQTSLSITEPEARRNLAIIVCVTLTGNTAVDVSVVLSTESGTAEGTYLNMLFI